MLLKTWTCHHSICLHGGNMSLKIIRKSWRHVSSVIIVGGSKFTNAWLYNKHPFLKGWIVVSCYNTFFDELLTITSTQEIFVQDFLEILKKYYMHSDVSNMSRHEETHTSWQNENMKNIVWIMS